MKAIGAIGLTLCAFLAAEAEETTEITYREVGKVMHDAQVHMIKKRYREAADLLAKVTESKATDDNRRADAYHMRGLCLSHLGDLEGALAMAHKSLEYKDRNGRRRMITYYEEKIRKRDEEKAKAAKVVVDKPVRKPTAGRLHSMVIEIHADGGLRLQDETTDLAAITTKAKRVAASDADASVLLRVHRDVGVSRIKQVVKAASAGGITNVTFATLQEGEARD